MNGQITGILLAAGRSTRFGSNKLIKKLQSGNSIGLESAENLSASVDNLIIVVNSLKDETSEMFLENGFKVLAAENANLGMGNSLKSGIEISTDSLGWIVGLADMPFIKLNTIYMIKEKKKFKCLKQNLLGLGLHLKKINHLWYLILMN